MSRIIGGKTIVSNEKLALEKENFELKENVKVLTEKVETLSNEKLALEKENVELKKKKEK